MDSTQINPKINYLKSSSADSAFRLANGAVVYNLEQLLDEIKKSNDAFYSHVNDSRNDFANWIRAIIGHVNFADMISSVRTREEFIRLLEKEINDIKNYTPVVSAVTSNPNVLADATAPAVLSNASILSTISTPIPTAPVAAASSASLSPTVSTSTPSSSASPSPIVSPIVSVPIIPTAPVTPIINSVASDSSVVSSPTVIVPITNPIIAPNTAPIATSIATPVNSPNDSVSIAALFSEEIYDFEEIFSVLLKELEGEIYYWDAPA